MGVPWFLLSHIFFIYWQDPLHEDSNILFPPVREELCILGMSGSIQILKARCGKNDRE